jgi:nucleoside-diphosphate-sugar epimerase
MKPPGEFFRESSILITGATGFIGQHLVKELSQYSDSIVTVQRKSMPTRLPVRQYECDIAHGDELRGCLKHCDPEIVIHLAGYKERTTNLLSFSEGLNTNVRGSLNVFSEMLNRENLESLIVLGTAEEYGRNECPFRETMRESPVSPYSFSKTCITHMAMLFHTLYHLPVTVLRPTLAYGPGQEDDMFLPSLIRSLQRNRSFGMTPGEQTRDFLYIDDLIHAILRVPPSHPSRGNIINIGSGIPTRILDVAHLAESLMDKKNLVKPGQIPYRENEIMDYYVDIDKAKKILLWKPEIPLHTGLKRTIDYYHEVLNR